MKLTPLSVLTAAALLCSAGAANAISIDFSASAASGSLPSGLRYTNVTNATGSDPVVDLLVTAGSDYSNSFNLSTPPAGLSSNGNGISASDFGQIGLDPNLEVSFGFQFFQGGTNTPAALNEIILSILDLDRSSSASATLSEFVQTNTVGSYRAGQGLTIDPSPPTGSGVRFVGVTGPVANPTSTVLTAEQSLSALELTFSNTSRANFIFFAGDFGTRFFNFAGELVFDPSAPPIPGQTVVPFELEASLGLLAVGGLLAGRRVLRRQRGQ